MRIEREVPLAGSFDFVVCGGGPSGIAAAVSASRLGLRTALIEKNHFFGGMGAGGYVVPAFTGLGAPYWNQRARGAIVGLTRGFNRSHLVRATLESLAYQSYDICKAMEHDSGIPIKSLKVDGGACANNFLMQFQSDILDCEVTRPSCIETTALGAAYLAGLAVGYWESVEEIKDNWSIDRVFTSQMDDEMRTALVHGWHKAVKCALLWGED